MTTIAVTPDARSAEAVRKPADPVALGLRVFIFSLTMLFGGLLYAYVVARTGGHLVKSGTGVAHITVPVWFWFSTFVMLASSVMLYGAWRAARAADAPWTASWLRGGAVLGGVFLALQVPGFRALLAQHRALAAGHVYIYGLIIMIAALHALHAAGGLVPLTRLAIIARRIGDDGARERAVRHMGTYWHFLAVVWWVIFTVIVMTG